MKTSVTDLFGTWQRRVELGLTQELANKRLASIKSAALAEEQSFWLDVVRLAFGLENVTESNKDLFIECFTAEDVAFPVLNNAELVKNLAAITICYVLEENENESCDAISLAVITSNFLGQYSSSDVPLQEYASDYLAEAIVDTRTSADREDMADTISNVSSTLAEGDYEFDQEDKQAIVNSITYLLQTTDKLKEETNVQWWLYGEYSPFLGQSFKEIGTEKMIPIAAIELYDLTTFNYEVRAAKALLHKAISLSSTAKLKDISLTQVVNAAVTSTRKRLLQNSSKTLDFAPCLNAIKSAEDFDPGDDWSKSYKKKTSGGDAKKLYSPQTLSLQLYRELLLCNIIE